LRRRVFAFESADSRRNNEGRRFSTMYRQRQRARFVQLIDERRHGIVGSYPVRTDSIYAAIAIIYRCIVKTARHPRALNSSVKRRFALSLDFFTSN
jgi:hypothetical protein